MLSLQNVKVDAGDKEILHEISHQFEKGKIYAIMGPNGSGKSTLVQTIIGNSQYSLAKTSSIMMGKKKLDGMSPDKRARLGIGITFQSPLALQGISVFQLLRLALKEVDVVELYDKIEKFAKELKIKKELIDRALNEGASGGERKKLEVLQMAILNPSIIFFDEIDTFLSKCTLFLVPEQVTASDVVLTNIFIKHDKPYFFFCHLLVCIKIFKIPVNSFNQHFKC